MENLRLSYDDVKGVFAIMPTPSLEGAADPEASATVDIDETVRGANALVDDDVDAIMINGTFGEAPTLTLEEWEKFTRTVIETVDGRVPVIAGPTTLNTRDTIERAKFARDIGADGLLLGRPMWCQLSSDATVQFYQDVADAVPELGIVVYHNPSAFKNRLTPELWSDLADIPQVVAAKYGSIDDHYRDCYAAVEGRLRLMCIEKDWDIAYQWFPEEALACWSSGAACDPLPAVRLREAIYSGDTERAEVICRRMTESLSYLFPEGDKSLFRLHTIALERARMDAAGYISTGPTRPPYHVTPEEYLESARESGRRWKQLADDLQSGSELGDNSPK
ncbi:Dihydrodipicolinate synthase/N-acetylneuraminate lyase [Halopenitus malekzadehii]|uniref:Dihydrodipicolinate synthase/N-acetylneuraminate lyase n=1 Tax=Halopenitus malekzadehii TaxID=1267564 RepID=A0A1H6JNS3_9EURY|nr:dihydrodipicolinate synthase family protein [Halopenitus malekzadehii]SEH64089.1 Dihydrodipicolinate synthase/N-acetylneuraminate lyase [Halopenitus malekzadehii]